MAKPKTNANKTMDVSKPGATAPSTTSRPVIITHRPIVKDPMVTATNSNDSADKSDSKLSPASPIGKTLQPPTAVKILKDEESSEDKAKDDEEVVAMDTDATNETETPVPDSKSKSEDTPSIGADEPAAKLPVEKTDEQPTKPEPEAPADKPKTDAAPGQNPESAEVEPTTEDEQTMVKKKQDDLESQAEKKRHELIDKLVTEKTYFLPIGKVTRQRGNKQALSILILVVVLAVAGLYGAVKLDIFNLPFKLPF